MAAGADQGEWRGNVICDRSTAPLRRYPELSRARGILRNQWNGPPLKAIIIQ